MIRSSRARVLLLGSDVAGVITGVTDGTSAPFYAAVSAFSLYFSGQGVTTSGQIEVEEADWDPALDMPYAGTWISLTNVLASSLNGGAQVRVANSFLALRAFLRVRISTPIGGGGTITVVARKLS